MRIYISGNREPISRLPNEDAIYLSCLVEGDPRIYEEQFRLDSSTDISEKILRGSSIEKAKKSYLELCRSNNAKPSVNFDSKARASLGERDKLNLLEFFTS